MSSVSGCRLVDARCWLRILKPQASLLLLPRLIVVVATCFFAEGHERSHHAHVALLGRPWRRLTVPAAHHSEATIHRRGEAKIPSSAGHWMRWSLQHSGTHSGRCYLKSSSYSSRMEVGRCVAELLSLTYVIEVSGTQRLFEAIVAPLTADCHSDCGRK